MLIPFNLFLYPAVHNMNQNPTENGRWFLSHTCGCRLHTRFLKQSQQECTIVWGSVMLWSQKSHCFINLKHSFQEVNRDCQQPKDNDCLLYTHNLPHNYMWWHVLLAKGSWFAYFNGPLCVNKLFCMRYFPFEWASVAVLRKHPADADCL